jgi:hypothetical protein
MPGKIAGSDEDDLFTLHQEPATTGGDTRSADIITEGLSMVCVHSTVKLLARLRG